MNEFMSRYRILLLFVFLTGLDSIQLTPLWGQQSGEDITESDPKKAAEMEARLVSGTRQLIFEGRRAGEGYFSADGEQMVFQSEREPGNPFYQIYKMDLTTGDIERVSPGHGKTTCAWIHPDGEQVLFSSTHDDPQAKQKQADEIAMRESGKERRYAWDYDETFELYSRGTMGTYRNLTNVKGYDAEGSYSPNGELIAFASNRNAYSEKLTDKEAELFKVDKASMIDIFIMNADGSDVRQLTDTLGYDGGPFFSPKGDKICWRRFSENGATAEIWTMDIDGSNKKQLTRMNAMSWAPYFHPSGKYLIFTTNKHGFGNFELYLVSADGMGKPVRVTFTAGFDGLPVFTPDGNRIAWTSNRTANGNSQIFIADWNHDAALKMLGSSSDDKVVDPVLVKAKEDGANIVDLTDPKIQPADIRQHVAYLCRQELAGRLTGSMGEKQATAYVAGFFEKLGLKPAGDNGTWFQEFEFVSGVTLGSANVLMETSDGKRNALELDKDWRPVSFSKSGSVGGGPIVFAGYGIRAPAEGDIEEYDSFVHMDVKDKWVIVFRFMPENISDKMRQHLATHSSLRYKAMAIRDLGAKGMIVVNGPNANARTELIPLRLDGSLAGTSIPVISISNDVAVRWMNSANKNLADIQTSLDNGDMMMGIAIDKINLGAHITIEQEKRTGRNIVGRLQVGDKPSAEAVLVGAHIDHLGRGPNSSSLATDVSDEDIHFGADDNASGVSGMLEIAQYLSSPAAKLNGAKRDVIFAAWSGEEMGLYGSTHFVKELEKKLSAHAHGNPHANPHGNPHANPHGTKPDAVDTHGEAGHGESSAHGKANAHGDAAQSNIAKGNSAHGESAHSKEGHGSDEQLAGGNTGEAHASEGHAAATDDKEEGEEEKAVHTGPTIYPTIAACINMDMIGRLEEKLVLQGIGSSSIWRGEVERRNAPVGLSITLSDDTDLPTDASIFYQYGVPILSAFTGSHADYHTPRDTPEKLNYVSAAKIARLMGLVTRSLVLRDEKPDYIVRSVEKQERRANLRAWLGTVPDYVEGDVKGVKLSGVSAGGPADKAGVKAGDVITMLAGRKIENIYDYTYAIEALKIDKEVDIEVNRNGKTVKMKVTPGSRE